MGMINFIETKKGKSIFTYSNYQVICNFSPSLKLSIIAMSPLNYY